MSTTDEKGWDYTRERLGEALRRFVGYNPSEHDRELVNEALMELIKKPLAWGNEDPNSLGVYWGRVDGTDYGILYVPNVETKRVAVADIGPAQS